MLLAILRAPLLAALAVAPQPRLGRGRGRRRQPDLQGARRLSPRWPQLHRHRRGRRDLRGHLRALDRLCGVPRSPACANGAMPAPTMPRRSPSAWRRPPGVITGAAAIMAAVFVSFAAAPIATVSQLGVGLTVAILLDATVVRIVLLPALMLLLGDRVWHVPTTLWTGCCRASDFHAASRGRSGARDTIRAHGDRGCGCRASRSFRVRRMIAAALLAVLVLSALAGAEALPDRAEYVSRLESICKPASKQPSGRCGGCAPTFRQERLAIAARKLSQRRADLRRDGASDLRRAAPSRRRGAARQVVRLPQTPGVLSGAGPPRRCARSASSATSTTPCASSTPAISPTTW